MRWWAGYYMQDRVHCRIRRAGAVADTSGPHCSMTLGECQGTLTVDDTGVCAAMSAGLNVSVGCQSVPARRSGRTWRFVSSSNWGITLTLTEKGMRGSEGEIVGVVSSIP